MSTVDLVLFAFCNTYWTFAKRDMDSLLIFDFCEKCAQAILIIINSILFFASYRYFIKTLSVTIVDRRQRNLFFAKKLILVTGILFSCLASSIFLGFYTQGLTNLWELLNLIYFNMIFILIQCALFLMVVGLNLDFRLQTQVLNNTDVMIVAIDRFGRVIFQVQIEKE